MAFQWGVIIFVIILAILPNFTLITPDFEAYCPVGGIQALGSYFLNNSLTCSMTSAQIVMGVVAMIGVFLFSKLFCSYICPLGTISEWLGKLGDKLKVRITLKGIIDKLFRSVKYVLLFVTLYYTLDSSELFCKKFDPYYAVTSGFDVDVVVLWAAIAIFLVVIGSIFVRMFWCKYFCPFGALSNIFKFTGFFVLLLAIYILLLKFGLEISYVWPLAIACIGGYFIEIFKFRTRFFPITKVTRNKTSCIDCQICSMNCPQAIDVASLDVVRDADCNLCGECVISCPEKGTLQFNKSSKLKWMPPVALIILIALGIYVGTFFEVPTIDQKWYAPSELAKAEVYTRSGLKNIKCYGSSTAFANQMRKVKGVMGVTTFVGSKTVKVYYDPSLLNEQKIEQAIFTPMKSPIKAINKDVKELKKVTFLLDKFFDRFDFNYLSVLLKQKTDAVGVQTAYGCPVIVTLFYPADAVIDEDKLTEVLESRKLSYTSRGNEINVELIYEVIGDYSYDTISLREYAELMFTPYDVQYARKKNYSDDVIANFTITLGKNRSQVKNLQYLASHLYEKNEILGIRTLLNKDLDQVLEISYVDSLSTNVRVLELLNADTLYFSYSNGKKGKVKNMFDFKKSEGDKN